MKNIKILLLVLVLTLLSAITYSKEEQNQKFERDFGIENYIENGKVVDYLNLRTIDFQGEKYALYYSATQNIEEYKSIIQEYVPIGQTVYNFDQMITIQVFYTTSDEQNAQSYATLKAEDLNDRSKGLPYSKATVTYNKEKDEGTVEFILSAGFNDNSQNKIIEWSVMRYKDFKNSNNQKYIMMTQFSKRYYGEKYAQKFASSTNILEKKYMVDFNEMLLPEIKFLSKGEWTGANFRKYTAE